MSCGEAGRKKSVYTGNQVGYLNHVGLYNFVAGGTVGLSAGTTVVQFIPALGNRAVWKRKDAKFDDKLLDAAYPTIDLQWYADIEYSPETTFRVSNRAFWIIDEEGVGHFYDARVDTAPNINVTVGEWLKENYESGDLSLILNNRDGFFNDYLPFGDKYKAWTGAKVKVRIGFGESIANYFTLFEGVVTSKDGLTATRDTVTIKCYDKFDSDEIALPPRVFSSDNFPDIDTNYSGKSVPLVYGDWSEGVPAYGCVNATCINALEEDPEFYLFKISDVALDSIDEVYLHRGDRAADKPQGPIRLADNVLQRDPESGEFSIPSSGVILDEPYLIGGKKLKAGAGTSGGLITSEDGFNFIEQGVKVGDKVVNGTATQSKVTIGNIEYKATAAGASGNGVGIEYYLLGPSFVDVDKNSPNKCYASLVGSLIRVGITQYTDGASVVQLGKHTAGAIMSAIRDNLACNALVRMALVGTVPFGYPENTRVSEVRQTVPVAPTYTSGGQNAASEGVITSVSNFQITVSSSFSYSGPDSEGKGASEYSISTVQYKFLKSDKITVKCRGKTLNLVSMDRLSDASPDIKQPNGISLAYDSTYWICDDATQAVYNISFDKEILRTLPYTDIDPSITQVSGLCVASDNQLWVTVPDQSKIYRYDLANNALGLVVDTLLVTGLTTSLAEISGVSVKADNTFWIVDKATSNFYLIDAFGGVNPFVVSSFNGSEFNPNATEILDVAFDSQTGDLTCVDRATNSFYRFDESDGSLVSQLEFSAIADNVTFVTGGCVAQDGTLFFVDQGTLSVYNYNDMQDASYNPAIIARDIIQKFGAHTYEEFDLSWMQTARQLSNYRARIVIDKATNIVKGCNALLAQFNTVLHLRFGKYALFYIHFNNFRANGKVVAEKDIIADSFKPGKETNQYFNSASGNFDLQPFSGKTTASDSYISTAAVSFAGKEYPRAVSLPNVYRRQDLDKLLPLFVRLAAPDPEFIEVTFGFRLIRSQMQDFYSLTFDESLARPIDGIVKKSGRRFSNVPCMIRKLNYDLDKMTVNMKLWSLGNTEFPGYEPQGATVGGVNDTILLSTVGRQGRISPIGKITGSGSDYVTLALVGGQDAEDRANLDGYLAWQVGQKLDLVDVATRNVLQTVTVKAVSGTQVQFDETITATVVNSVANTSGFLVSGTMLQQSTYLNLTETQKAYYASFGKPSDNYPTSRTQELEEQRSGAHSYPDGGLPYILYPIAFNSSY